MVNLPEDAMPAPKATAKKPAKTIKKPAPKTVKRVTQADIEANFDRIQKGFEEIQKAHQKTEKTVEEIGKAHKETEKIIEEIQKAHRETEKTLNKAIGGLSNTVGTLVERFMTVGLPQKFKQFGFAFNRVTTVKWADGENNIYTEIDGLLENGDQAMVVEVKTTLRNEDVDDHLERMERVRKYADLHGDSREFLGAIAATIVDKSSRSYAVKKGFFVIEPAGEDVKITKPVSEKVW
jgi:hypothetical protein